MSNVVEDVSGEDAACSQPTGGSLGSESPFVVHKAQSFGTYLFKIVIKRFFIYMKNNKGQSDLSVGGIVANWGVPTPKSPLPMGRPGLLCNIMLLGTTQVSLPNGISFRPTALAGCTSVTDDVHTYRRTNDAR